MAPVPTEPTCDGALLARLAAGDADACTELVRKYLRPATLFAAQLTGDRDEAEDIVQRAFILAVERASELDTSRPFAPWLFAVVRRLALKRHARQRHRRALWERWRPEVSSSQIEPDAAIAAASDLALVRGELRTFSPMQAACFELVVLRDVAAEDVAAMYEISEATVRQHVFRARRALRDRLAGVLGPTALPWTGDPAAS